MAHTLPTPPETPLSPLRQHQLEQLASLRAFYQSTHVWTIQTQATLARKASEPAPAKAEAKAPGAELPPSPAPSAPTPPTEAAHADPPSKSAEDSDSDTDTDMDTDDPETGTDAPRTRTRWARRKNGMKLSIVLNSRSAGRRPKRMSPSPPLQKDLIKRPITDAHASIAPPSQDRSLRPITPLPPTGTSKDGITLLRLFQELMDARMENLQRMELMLRNMDPPFAY